MRFVTSLRALALMVSIADAHFILLGPTSVGYNDEEEDVAPCGGFTPGDRSKGVTDFPLGGIGVSVLSTHSTVTWEFKAALLSDINNWVPLTPKLDQKGVGYFCEPQIPGNPAWVGQDAVLQVIQHAADGALYQCAAVRFVNGGPGPAPVDCKNQTGITATWQAGTLPPPASSSSSQAPPPPGTSSTLSKDGTTSPSVPTGTISSASSSLGPASSSSTTTSHSQDHGHDHTNPTASSSTSGKPAPTSNSTSTKPPPVPAGAPQNVAISGGIMGAFGLALLAML